MTPLPVRMIVVTAFAAPLALAGCATTPTPLSTSSTNVSIAEAKAFMEDYAADLRAHNRAAIADRYHPDGAHMIFDGESGFESFAALRDRYLEGWRGPDAFAWRDLVYEPVGADAMLVNGGFEWTAGGKVRPMSYTALLKRHAGGWRIRMENETPIRKPAG